MKDVLEVMFPDDLDLEPYAIAEQGHPVWEWVVPAELINARASVRLLSEAELDGD